jgi:hypothetical protein
MRPVRIGASVWALLDPVHHSRVRMWLPGASSVKPVPVGVLIVREFPGNSDRVGRLYGR